MLSTCPLQKQAELLTSVGDDLVVTTMVPHFSTEVGYAYIAYLGVGVCSKLFEVT